VYPEGIFSYNRMMKDKIKTKWVIKLPSKSKILVEVGDVVDQDQIVAEVEDLEIKNYNYSAVFNGIEVDKIIELNSKFKNELVSQGDLICIKGGFLGKKICFPESGKFVEINEFGSLKIEIDMGDKKEIKAPVRSKVSKIEDGKLILDFWVKEFKGEGLVEGKTWADGQFENINRLDKLGPNLDGKILFTDNLDSTFLLKAEVVGVVGIVTNTKVDELKVKIPVLFLEDDIWQELLKLDKNKNRFLLNSVMGRLLLVLE